MPDRLCLVFCDHFRKEAEAVVAERGMERIRVSSCRAGCGHPCLKRAELEGLRADPAEHLLVFGSACLDGLESGNGIEFHRLDTCLDMVAPPRLLDHHLRKGAYLITPGWLENWHGQVSRQGPDKELVRALWQESVTSLLLLDTGLGQHRSDMEGVADYLGLPFEVLPVGVDYLAMRVEKEVLRARSQVNKELAQAGVNQAQRQAADRAVAIEFLHSLSQSLVEDEVVEKMVGLFSMLFHAGRVEFLPVLAAPEEDSAAPQPGFQELDGGFQVTLVGPHGPVGLLLVFELGFPERLGEYLNLTLSMSSIVALAIENARAYRTSVESKEFQRLTLDVLDIFYEPQGSAEDLDKVLGLVRAFAGVDGIALRLKDGEDFVYRNSEGFHPAFLANSCSRCLPNPEKEGNTWPQSAVLTNRGSVWLNDIPDGDGACACAAAGYRSLALIQLPVDGRSFGILQLNHRLPGHFSTALIEQLESIARSLAIGLERRWAEEELRRANAALEARVRERTHELATRNRELRNEILVRARTEQQLESRSAELKARLRELRCLYAVSNLLEHHEGSLDNLLQSAVSMVPAGWNDPARTFVRLVVDGREFRSDSFRTTPWKMASSISLKGRIRGDLEVFAESEDEESPFLEEETHLIGTMADLIQGLVDHSEVEEEKRKIELQLAQSQKLEAIGTLAGGIAHDFNNALTPILTLTDLDLMNLPGPDPKRRHLEIIQKAAYRAKDLVDQILLFSRRKDARLAPVDLSPLVKEILKLIRASIPSTIEIRQEIDSGPSTVLANPTQIHQIIMNLCTNAAHAMQEQGGLMEVRLECSRVLEHDAPEAGELKPGEYVVLEVSDTGMGMTPDIQQRIFEPFFTTKEAGKGTGMGLSVVHGIVQSYGGAIRVQSSPGEGSSFTVLLPKSDAAPLAANPATQEIPRGSERILVVDDEEAICASLTAMLQNLGYRAESSPGSLQALRRIEEDPQWFDLLVTDMTMPVMTGLDLVERLRALRPDLPVVLCSGFSERLEAKDPRLAGVQAVLQKPFQVGQLAQAVRRELDRRPAGSARL